MKRSLISLADTKARNWLGNTSSAGVELCPLIILKKKEKDNDGRTK